MPDAHDSRVEA